MDRGGQEGGAPERPVAPGHRGARHMVQRRPPLCPRAQARLFVRPDRLPERGLGKVRQVVLYADRPSINSSEDARRFLRDSRRRLPGRDVRAFLFPAGSPFLSAIGELWNRLKDAVAKRYRYLTLNALRWATMEHARTAVAKLDCTSTCTGIPKNTCRPRRPGDTLDRRDRFAQRQRAVLPAAALGRSSRRNPRTFFCGRPAERRHAQRVTFCKTPPPASVSGGSRHNGSRIYG